MDLGKMYHSIPSFLVGLLNHRPYPRETSFGTSFHRSSRQPAGYVLSKRQILDPVRAWYDDFIEALQCFVRHGHILILSISSLDSVYDPEDNGSGEAIKKGTIELS